MKSNGAVKVDLNWIGPDSDSPNVLYLASDNSITTDELEVHFRHLEAKLIHMIKEADLIVGCVAWLTSTPILNALAGVPSGVSIVVQKEDFLRPDIDSRGGWAARLRQRYEALIPTYERYGMGNLVGQLSVSGDASIQPVRCMGNYNTDKSPAWPRMHNKFLVFCQTSEPNPDDEMGYPAINPYAVWSGSFNLTKNANLSLENAIVIRNRAIVEAYYNEWQQVLALSEPLDWTAEWCAPEWRIGT